MRLSLALLLGVLGGPLCAAEADDQAVRATLQEMVRAAERQTVVQQRIDGLSQAAKEYASFDLEETARLLERVTGLLFKKDFTLPWEFDEALRALLPHDLERAVAIRQRVRTSAARAAGYREELPVASLLADRSLQDLQAALATARRYRRLPGGDNEAVEAAAERLYWLEHPIQALAMAELVETADYLPEVIGRAVVQLLVAEPPRGLAEAAERAGDEQLWYALWHTGQASWQSWVRDPLAAAAAVAAADQPPTAEGALAQAALLRFASAEQAIPLLLALPAGEARTLGLAYHLTAAEAPLELRRPATERITEGLASLPLRFQRLFVLHQLAAADPGAALASRHASAALQTLLAIAPERWDAEPKRGPASMQYSHAALVSMLVRLLGRVDPGEALRLRPRWSRLVDYDAVLVDIAYAQASSDLPGALATLRRHSARDALDHNLTALAIWLATERTAGAQAVAQAIGSDRHRDVAWAGLVEELANVDPALAEALLSQIGEPLTRATTRFELARRALAAGHPAEAERLAVGIAHGLSRSDALAEVGGAHLAAGRLAEARRLAGMIGDAGPRSELLAAVVEALLEQEAGEEAQTVALLIPDFATRVEVLGGLVARLAHDRPAAVALLARDPSAEARQELMARLAETLIGTNPDEAYRFAGTLPYAPLRDVVLGLLVKELVPRDLDRALAILGEISGEWQWSEAALPATAAAARGRRSAAVVLPLFRRLSWSIYPSREAEGPAAELLEAMAGWLATQPADTWEPALRGLLPVSDQEERGDRLSPRLLVAVIERLLEAELPLAQRLTALLPGFWRQEAEFLLLDRLRDLDHAAALALAREAREPAERAWRLLRVVGGQTWDERDAVLDEVARLARQVKEAGARLALQRAVAARR